MRVILTALLAAALLAVPLPGRAVEPDEPVATIALLSNLYLTTLPAAEIKDETGRERGWLAREAPRGIERAAALVNQLNPDAVVVLGSITWTGRGADLDLAARSLEKIRAPVWVTPGHLDRREGSLKAFEGRFGSRNASNKVVPVKGVHLAFAPDLHDAAREAAERVERQLASAGDSAAVLLFGGRPRSGRPPPPPSDESFWNLVEKRRIALRVEPTRYGHRIGYERTLPVWHVGSTAWSERGAVSLIRV